MTTDHTLIDAGTIEHALTIPTELFRRDNHAIYWIGLHEESHFRCNNYLLISGHRSILIDPGSRAHFAQSLSRVAEIMPPTEVTDLIISHQDPDVGASMVDWLDLNPDMRIVTSSRAHVLLPYFGKRDYQWLDIAGGEHIGLDHGATLRFITSPFLHSPAAFTTYDPVSQFLFSGDIWAAISSDWTLMVQDFATHRTDMDKFHLHYMSCNRACRSFIDKLAEINIEAILPQHGSLIGAEMVAEAIDYLRHLRCGLDLEQPELTRHPPL
ncbi:MAG: MBL fold metallo-hydrolase [Mariprofundales bacterium]|nr:MBL fold metallo-hydrolase [Mariprofundales bacterium]